MSAEKIKFLADSVAELAKRFDAMVEEDCSKRDAGEIVGHSWAAIQRAQNKQGSLHEKVDLKKQGDYGADPLGDGKFRMVPSGDIVDYAERTRRLKR